MGTGAPRRRHQSAVIGLRLPGNSNTPALATCPQARGTRSRLDDKRKGAIVVVMQRVHLYDLTGFLCEQSDEWVVLELPAIATVEQSVLTWGGFSYQRQLDDLLAPEREPLGVLNALKAHLGSAAFSAQYQQQPEPPGGAMVKRVWVKRYKELPPQVERVTVLQSWDTASKGGPDNDWSVCTTWIVTRKRQWFLVNVWRGRVDYPTLKNEVINQAKIWKPSRVLVEDAGARIALIQELRAHVSGIIGVTPKVDKETRMSVATAKFEAGQVFFPETRMPWLPDLEAELFAFPGGRHDDQCDSISQALDESNVPFMTWLTPEVVDELMVRSRLDALRRGYHCEDHWRRSSWGTRY